MLEAHSGEHLDPGRDHVRRVVAPAQPGLDHRHLDAAARQLAVRGGGQRLELGHAVVLVERAIDHPRRMRRALDRRRERGAVERALAHLDPLREGAQVRRRVGPGAEPVTLQDRRDHPRRRRLAVRPDDVDAREPALRHPEHRHELVHAVEPEPHAEQLEVEQVVLRFAQVHAG